MAKRRKFVTRFNPDLEFQDVLDVMEIHPEDLAAMRQDALVERGFKRNFDLLVKSLRETLDFVDNELYRTPRNWIHWSNDARNACEKTAREIEKLQRYHFDFLKEKSVRDAYGGY